MATVCALAVLGAAGCMVGPDYTRPSAPVADAWLDIKGAASGDRREDAEWWTRFEDPVLNSLVSRALSQNLTLRQAGLRVIQARAQRGISVGEFFPQQQAVTAEVGANQLSANTPLGLGDRSFGNYSVGLEAAWELDFWGRFRRGIESTDAALDASVADYDAVLVLLAADVASTYVEIRSLQEQLGFTDANVKAQQDTLELTQVRFKAGAVSELDVTTARATLANTQSLVPELEDALHRTVMSMCVLLGRPPADLASELEGTRAVPTAPAEIALGVPADLLRRRPDVRRAERTAAALSAQIGVATAELYPAISIKGTTGFQTTSYQALGHSPSAHNLFDANSFAGFIGLDVNWPILNYGRIENNIRVADAQFQQAIVAYQNTVLQAAADVETGLSSFLRNRERSELLEQSVQAAARTVELSLIQYRQGAADFLRVNQAQVDLVNRQNSLVIARAGIALGAIDTYRALGGGWETRVGREFVSRDTIDEMRRRTDWGDLLAPDYGQGSDFFIFPRPHGAAAANGRSSASGDEQNGQP